VSRLVDRWVTELQTVVGPVTGVVVDVGVGDRPGLAGAFPGGHPTVGVEHRLGAAAVAHDPLPWLWPVAGDAGALPFPDSCADLVTCVDLLEHLPTYRPAISELARITRGRCIVSVPWEPWFRLGNLAQGRDVRRLGGDPDQEHAFTPKRLVRALRRGFRDVELHPCFPWLIAECRGPRT
jgi:SAM-dependent methyltransferase